MSSRAPLVALSLAVLFATGCASRRPEYAIPPSPLTEAEMAELAAQASMTRNMVKIEDDWTLFLTLDKNMRSWRELHSTGSRKRSLRLESLEEAMTRLVYLNFDAILVKLQHGDPERRVTAAAALGFSVIPAPDEPGGDSDYPLVHPRAVPHLVSALEEGDDALMENALMALARIRSPDTPIPLLTEIMVTHHIPAVRSNATWALAGVLGPEHKNSALSHLYAALEDEEPKVRLHAVTALGKLQEPSCLGQLLGVFAGDSSPLVQANAARILGTLNDPTVVPELAQGLLARQSIIRYCCEQSLQQLTGQNLGTHPSSWIDWYQEEFGSR